MTESEKDERIQELEQEIAVIQKSFGILSVKLNTLQQLMSLTAAAISYEKKLEKVMELIMSKMGVEAASILEVDDSKQELFFRSARGEKADAIMKFRLQLGQGIAGWCAQENVTLAVSDVKKDARYYKAISDAIGFDTRSILCVPIMVRGKVYGVIELVNKIEDDVFTSSDIEMLTDFANFINILGELKQQLQVKEVKS